MRRRPSLNVGLVFDDSLDSPDGVAQHVKTLGAWLSSKGNKVSYLVGQTKLSNWAGGQVYSLAKNQTVIFNGNKLSIPLPAKKSNIEEVLKTNQFDVIHVMMPYSPFLAQKIINSVDQNTAIVGTFHVYPSGVLSKAGSRALKIMYGGSLSKFTSIISVSSAAADFADKAFGIKSQVIPNPINLSAYKKVDGNHNQLDQIVFLGRLVKRKGAAQLIEAFALLSKNEPRTKLIIAGQGPLRKSLEQRAKQLKINHRVEFKGFIEEDQKPQLLSSAQIACFPSLNGESFGIVLVEAMAAGAGVVVGGDNPGYRSVLGEQPDLLVDPSDKITFAAKLEQFLSDDALRQRLHKWQQTQVPKYDINVVGQQVLDVYRRAIARLDKNSHNKTHE